MREIGAVDNEKHIRPRRDERMIDDLINHNVEIKQAPPSTGPSLAYILINFLPVLLIIGFFFFMMRQMQQMQGT